MKKRIALMVCAALCALALTGCGGGPASVEAPAQAQKVDLDLTALSSTMVYAEVYDIVGDPAAHVGQTIRIRGPYYATSDAALGTHYSFVVVEDATACCQQGIEVVLNGEHVWPDDYPQNDQQVEVTGTYGSYQEEGITYYCILTDEFKVL